MNILYISMQFKVLFILDNYNVSSIIFFGSIKSSGKGYRRRELPSNIKLLTFTISFKKLAMRLLNGLSFCLHFRIGRRPKLANTKLSCTTYYYGENKVGLVPLGYIYV